MLQQETPDDYVLATGNTYSVREFLETCCRIVALDIDTVYEIDQRYFRAAEVNVLCGDASKARRKLRWEPKVDLSEGIERTIAYYQTHREKYW